MIFGIDLGTTFSLISHLNASGIPAICPCHSNSQKFQTPSLLHIGPRGCLVGDIVEELLAEEPGLEICRFPKLSMGENTTVYTDHAGISYSAEAVSALVLRKLRNDAEAALNESVTGVVISVPAHFNEAQRQATQNAGRLADLPVLGLVEEPVAAATFFGLEAKRGEKTIFVFDIGGGTLDATLLQATPEGLYVLATEGSKNIGGKNFDDAIMQLVRDQFMAQHRVDVREDLPSWQKLRQFATAAKIELCTPGVGAITRPLLLSGKSARVTLTRDQFESAIEPWLEACTVVCQDSLKAAGIHWSEIDDLVMTGGSSLVPAVERMIRRVSNLPPDRIRRQHPHAAIAYGAALLAEQFHGSGKTAAPPLRQLVTSNDLGLRLYDNEKGRPEFHVMITKNTPLPASYKQTIYTRRENQENVSLEILQRKDTYSEPETLGTFTFGPLKAPEKNHPIEVEMGYDSNGRVTVTASDPRSGKSIAREFGGKEEQELGRVFKHLQSLVIQD
jgi:molecular chaperone DnaK